MDERYNLRHNTISATGDGIEVINFIRWRRNIDMGRRMGIGSACWHSAPCTDLQLEREAFQECKLGFDCFQ